MATEEIPTLTIKPLSILRWRYLYLCSTFARIPFSLYNFTDQTIIVTGSNTGLDAANVILAVRDVAKGNAAVEDIIRTTDITRERVEVWQLDLSSFDSIISFSQRVNQLERLDVLVSNAGITTPRWEEVEGMENHIVINCFAPILIAILVLPKLRQSARTLGNRGRLSFVGSELAYIASFKPPADSSDVFDALNKMQKSSCLGNRHAISKLVLFYAVRLLASVSSLTSESDVLINIIEPRTCQSDLLRDDMGWLLNWLGDALMAGFGRTPEVGARMLVHAAIRSWTRSIMANSFGIARSQGECVSG